LPINLIGTEISDVVYYNDNKWYIELLKDNLLYSVLVDITNNTYHYQGNVNYLDINGISITGLKYYPVLSKKDNIITLNKLPVDMVYQTEYQTEVDLTKKTKLYNYDMLQVLYNGSSYLNLAEDVICPYTNISTFNNNGWLYIELNPDV